MLTKRVKEWHQESFSLISGLFSLFFIATSLAFHFTALSFDGIIRKITFAVDGQQRLYEFEPSRFQQQYMRINAR